MDKETKIIEINGIKMEVDMRTVKIVENFRIGDKIKVLLKDYSTYVSHPAIIVGFDQFEALPTIIIAYLKSSYSEVDIKFVYLNSASTEIEICKSNDHDIDIDQKTILKAFEVKIRDSEKCIQDLERKKDYFLKNFNKHFVCSQEK